MTQQQLASALGISHQQIQKYENGTNRIGVGRLAEIASALGVPISRLLTGEASGSAAPQLSADIMNLLGEKEALELVQLYASIGDEQTRSRILALVRTAATLTST